MGASGLGRVGWSLAVVILVGCGGTTVGQVNHSEPQNGADAGGPGGRTAGGGGASGGDVGVNGGASGAGGDFVLRPPTSHRATADACSRERGPGDADPYDADGGLPCTKDTDCTEGDNGRCMKNPYGGVGLIMIHTQCSYDACFADTDCGAGLACACGLAIGGLEPGSSREGNACVHADCHIDADCGPGNWCSLSWASQYCASEVPDGYFCRTPRDTCVEDTDCDGLNHCAYSKELGHWACVTRSLCSG
jgi:hypothetical protein